jgi:DNA polymerase I-like protein with 3'-5' exonuclease and polymerase domains/uracil-DNA glycosylase
MIYVRPCGPKNARIMLVGEAPGEDDEKQGRPFCGAAGYELTTELREAGIVMSDCFVTNVVRFRPNSNNLELFITGKKAEGIARNYTFHEGFWVAPFVLEHIKDLWKEIDEVRPHVIVAIGNTALWALSGRTGIMKWRGSQMKTSQGQKMVPLTHPAAVLRDYSLRVINVHDLKNRVLPESLTPELILPPHRFTLRPSFEQTTYFLADLLSWIENTPRYKITVDIETRKGQIACLGIGRSKFEALCIPFMCHENPEGYWPLKEELWIVEMLRKILTHPNAWVVGQNFLYDSQYIVHQFKFIPNCLQDTALWHHVLFCGMLKRLEFLASMYAEFYCYWKDEGKEWHTKVQEEDLWHYNCLDCVYTYEVSDALEKSIIQQNLARQVHFQQALFVPAEDMILRGVRIDQSLRDEFSRELGQAMKEREQFFQDLLGHPLNPRSYPQMQRLFYTDFKQRPVLSRSSGNPTLDDKALEIIITREPLLRPLVRAIQQYRSLGVFKSTFVEAELDPDGRLRCSYNLTGAETFRWSSSENAFWRGTNLQNIPKGESSIIAITCKELGPITVSQLQATLNISKGKLWDALDEATESGIIAVSGQGEEAIVSCIIALPNVRKMFIPDTDYVLMDWDLDRADLQVVVWEADDKDLKQMLREGVDLHTENAKVLLCPRQVAKMWVHGTNYGGSARTMASNCGITTHQSDTMRRRWFAAHPGILDWHHRTEKSLATTRSVWNQFGYRRLYFDRVESILPAALAWVPQSTVALVINTGLRRIFMELPEIELLLQVHDSLVMQTKSENVPDIYPRIRKCLEVVVPYPDPLVIPVSGKGSYSSWGECVNLDKLGTLIPTK